MAGLIKITLLSILTMNPLISVIVPVYNVAAYLRECMDSIVNQSYSNLEIICVNDGSTDASPEILKEYEERDSRVRVVHQKNGGLSAARNTGLKYATGEWVAYVDSDDALDLQAAEIWVKSIRDDIDLLCFGVRMIGEASQETLEHREKYFECKVLGEYDFDVEILKKITVTVWNKLFRRSYIVQHNMQFPVGLYYEDGAFFSQFAPFVNKVVLLPDKLYIYRQRENSITGNASKSAQGLHYYRILHPVRKFYERENLLEKKKDIYLRFFDVSYWAARVVLPPKYRVYGAIIVRALVDRWKIEELSPKSSMIKSLNADLAPVSGIYKLISGLINHETVTAYSWFMYKLCIRWEIARVRMAALLTGGQRKSTYKEKLNQLRELYKNVTA